MINNKETACIEKQCYAEIIQRLEWLLNNTAGGKGYNDYVPDDHNYKTWKYINDIETCLEIIVRHEKETPVDVLHGVSI